jgi:hypothetical protein
MSLVIQQGQIGQTFDLYSAKEFAEAKGVDR